MKKYKILMILICGIFFTACNTSWDDYFESSSDDSGSAVSPLNLSEYLESKSEYSEFFKLLKETNYDQFLTRDQTLTIWAPNNDFITPEIMNASLSDKRRFVKNHINNVALYEAKLLKKTELTTLQGKILPLAMKNKDIYLDNIQIVEANQICRNGVIHGISGTLVPRKNIYEYLDEAGDNYSIYRDSLFQHNKVIFDPIASFPIGVNEVGNTIYDSVFHTYNKYLVRANISSESEAYTLFLPDNTAMTKMITNFTDYFNQVGKDIVTMDSLMVMSWMLQATIHSGRITNYEGVRNRASVFGRLWRTDKQLVETNYAECSNGFVYRATDVKAPASMYMESVVIYPHHIFYLPAGKDRTAYYGLHKAKNPRNTIWSGDVINGIKKETTQVDMDAAADGYFMFKSIVRNISTGLSDTIPVLPGYYKVCVSFRGYACPSKVDMYINEDHVAQFASNQGGGAKWGFDYVPIANAGDENAVDSQGRAYHGTINKNFYLDEKYGFNTLQIKLVNTAAGTRLTPEWVILIPTEENY